MTSVNFSASSSASVSWGRSQAARGPDRASSEGARPDPGQRLEQDLTAAGVDEETATAIKSELHSLFEEAHASGGPPSDSLKESVNAIFKEHGLEASEFLRPPGGGPGGPGGPKGPPPSGGPEGSYETSESTTEEDILAALEKLAESESDATTFAELAVDVLYGVDEEA